jgi:hypothetical protein
LRALARRPPYDFEILIKSFLRFDKLSRLVRSVRRHYPGVTIRIADDSPACAARDAAFRRLEGMGGCVLYPLPENVGISVGRNRLVREVGTPYFVLADDDLVFLRRTTLETLQTVLEADEHALLAAGLNLDYGIFRRYQHGHIERDGQSIRRCLYGDRAPRAIVGGVECVPCGLTPNFFMAKTALFRRHRLVWDERLKINEHTWFFADLPAGLNVYFVPGVAVGHFPTRWGDDAYRRYRYDRAEGRRWVDVRQMRVETVRIHESRFRTAQGRVQRWMRRVVDRLAPRPS